MATELLRASARQGTVPSALQQDTLIPLESLIARNGHDRQGRRGRDPEQLLAVVTAALRSPPLPRAAYDESA